MEYVEFEQDDLIDVAKVYVETFNAEPWCDEWTMDSAFERLHRMLSAEYAYGLLARADNGQVVGMALGEIEMYYDGPMFTLKEFCVRNALHGMGIGGTLLEQLEKNLKEQGVKSISLFTSRDASAEEFYKKRGYQTIPDMIMMGKMLDE